MDLQKIAEIGNEIYTTAQYLSTEAQSDIEHLKQLAIALFAELDSNNE